MTYRLHQGRQALRTSALCVFVGLSSQTLISTSVHANNFPVCQSSSSDIDGDGWGWENNRSCQVNGSQTSSSANTTGTNDSRFPTCSSASIDPDGDGWGWENNRTCRVGQTNSGNSTPAASVVPQTSAASGSSSTTAPVCFSTASDDDNDGWGFENGRSCRITSASVDAIQPTGTSAATAPPPVAAANAGFSNGHPVCLTDSSDAGNNGFGYENGRTCVVLPGATATRNDPLLNQRSCIHWLEIGYGNYRLQNNTWNDSEVYSDNWSQCIELTGSPGNYVAKWDYNWLGRNEGNEFAVKSYPQVYYGRKTQYNVSGTVAETGLPASVNNLKQFWVEYDYSETGTVERNVALESFFHTSCEAEEHNKQYEMMVWVGVPNIRTPGTPVTTVTLSGQEWDVYINPALSWAYVAFVAKEPSTRGILDWNAFVDWSRFEGPRNGVPAMARNTCMGAIEIGTETFWGSGTFTLNKFRVN